MDKKEALKIVKKDCNELENLPAQFKKDKEIVLEAVKQDGYVIAIIDESLKKDKEIVLEALKKVDKDYPWHGGYSTYLTPKELLGDVDYSLRNDPDILAIVNKKK